MTLLEQEPHLVRPTFHFERNFTQIPNRWLRDARVSFKARGLLAMLFSQPTGFAVTLAKLAGDDGPDGISAIRSAVSELEEAGYLRRVLRKDNQGHDWHIQDPFEAVDNPLLSAFENRTRSGSACEKRMRKSHAYKNTVKEHKDLRDQPQESELAPCGHSLIDDRHCVLGCPPVTGGALWPSSP